MVKLFVGMKITLDRFAWDFVKKVGGYKAFEKTGAF